MVKSQVELDNSEAHKDRKDNWDIYQNSKQKDDDSGPELTKASTVRA